VRIDVCSCALANAKRNKIAIAMAAMFTTPGSGLLGWFLVSLFISQ
jgi:hypothetical protein